MNHVLGREVAVSRFAPLLAGALALALYAAMARAGLTWDLGGADGGDLASAVYTLGLAHPPGYPTYLLLGQLARLLPVASPAYRLNLFSAFAASGAVAVLASVISRNLAKDDIFRSYPWAADAVGAAVAVAFGLAEVVWTQAIITEVYALATLFCAAILGLTFYTARAGSQKEFTRRLALLALVAALGMGSHYITVFMDLFAGVYLLLIDHKRVLHPANLIAVAGFAAGLLVFAYLPLRAGKVPGSNWGNPDTLDRFLSVVRAEAYASRLVSGLMVDRLAALIRVLVEQLGIAGLALVAIGLSDYWDTDRRLLIALGIAVGANLWFTTQYESADTVVYVCPTLLLLSLATATGIRVGLAQALASARLGYLARSLAACALGLALWLPLLIRGWGIVSQATTQADAFGALVMKDAPPQSVIISDNDSQTFAIRYAALVSVGRPDVVLIDERMWNSFDWFGADLAHFYPDLHLSMSNISERSIASLVLRMHTNRPVIFTYQPEQLPAFYRLAALGDHLYLLEKRAGN
jgi:hypothetical protein